MSLADSVGGLVVPSADKLISPAPPLAASGACPSEERRQGRIALAVFFAGLCTFLDLYSTQAILPFLMGFFRVSELTVSLTVSVSTLAVALAAPLVGLFADAVGRKRVIVTSIFALFVPTLLAAFSSTLGQLIFWRFLQGLFLPGIFAVTIAYIGEEAAPGRVGRIASAYMSGSVVGGFLGRFLSGLVATHWGWRSSFVLLAGITLLGAFGVWLLLPRSRVFVRQAQAGVLARAMLGHLRNPRLLAGFAVGFNVLFSLVATFTYANFHLAGPPYLLNSAQLGSVFFVYLFGVVVTPIAGRWIDRLGVRPMLAGATALSMCGVLLALAGPLWIILVGLALVACGVFISQSAAMGFIGRNAPSAKSAAAGLYVSIYYLGGSAGGLIPGVLWQWGGWGACVGLVLAVQALTLLLAWRFLK